MKKILFIILVGLIIAIFGAMNTSDISISANSDDELSYFLEESILENNEVYQSSFTRTESYYSVFQNWTDLELIKSNNIYKVNSNEYFGGESTTIVDSFSYGTNTTKLQSEDSVSFDVSILNEGLYQIYLDYYIIPDVKISPVISLLINSESQFTEMNYLEFKVDWGIESDIHYDRFGDELTPKSFITEKWYLSMGLIDPNRFYTEPLYFYFDEGINNIDISVLEGSFLLGNTRSEERRVGKSVG